MGGSGIGVYKPSKCTETRLLPMILLSTEKKKKSKGSEWAWGRGRMEKKDEEADEDREYSGRIWQLYGLLHRMGCLGTWQSRQILTCRAFKCTHINTHTHTHSLEKIHETLPHEASKFNLLQNKWAHIAASVTLLFFSSAQPLNPFCQQTNLFVQ